MAGFGSGTAWAIRWAGRSFARDLEQRRGFLWLPVAFALAAGLRVAHFDTPRVGLALAAVVILAAVAMVFRHRAGLGHPALVLATVAALGWLAAEVSVLVAEAPRLTYERTVTVSGFIETIEERGTRGHRLVVRTLEMVPEPREGVPRRVRVTARGFGDDIPVGAAITFRARLSPPSPPLVPGGYDFARVAWFDGIGAIGFVMGQTEPWTGAPAADRRLQAWSHVESLRRTVSERVRAVLPGDDGAIAAALLVGDRGSISADVDEAMRVSGLSHVLSISGLHMTLVTGCIFFLVRLLLAAAPPVALRYPIKHWAAWIALAGCGAYLLVSGMGVPATRAAIMVGVGLVAVILDRKAFSLRVVAVSALLIFAIEPHAVLEPGTQMSFAAVIALISGYEAYAARRRPPSDSGDISVAVRFAGRAARWIVGTAATSLLAGFATFPAALHHFNRIAPLGLIANLAATPIVGFVVMPAGLFSAVALPLGLEAVPLAAMGWGIDAMIRIAETVAAWTPQGGVVGQPSPLSIVLMATGGLWLCLWFGPHRLAGIPVILAGMALIPIVWPPDLLVDGAGRRALLRLPDGTVQVLGDADDFQTALWLAHLGRVESPGSPDLVNAVRCDPDACILEYRSDETSASAVGERALAALVKKPEAFVDECHRADLVITALAAPPWCRRVTAVVDATDLAETGTRAYAIRWPSSSSEAGAGAIVPSEVPSGPGRRIITLDPMAQSVSEPPAPWHRGSLRQ